jgi:hypothetical protein
MRSKRLLVSSDVRHPMPVVGHETTTGLTITFSIRQKGGGPGFEEEPTDGSWISLIYFACSVILDK